MYRYMKIGIYKITNSVNGKFYIGSSLKIEERWNYHQKHLNGNYHVNPKLQHAWNFYGGDKFEFSIIEEVVDVSKLFEREQFYLDTFKPYMRDIGYNICPTATGGDNITHHPDRDTFIQKMSTISAGENNPMFGRNHTDATISDMKDKAKGRFSLPWFINKYGGKVGQEKYDERRLFLKNRKINYSHPSKTKGTSGVVKLRSKDKKKISESKARLKPVKAKFIADINSNKFTIKQIQDTYGVSKATVMYHQRKLKVI